MLVIHTKEIDSQETLIDDSLNEVSGGAMVELANNTNLVEKLNTDLSAGEIRIPNKNGNLKFS